MLSGWLRLRPADYGWLRPIRRATTMPGRVVNRGHQPMTDRKATALRFPYIALVRRHR
jgi:hypothetical protein